MLDKFYPNTTISIYNRVDWVIWDIADYEVVPAFISYPTRKYIEAFGTSEPIVEYTTIFKKTWITVKTGDRLKDANWDIFIFSFTQPYRVFDLYDCVIRKVND